MLFRKWFISLVLIVLIFVITGFTLIYFLPQSIIEKSHIPGLPQLQEKFFQRPLKSEYTLVIKNENSEFRVLKNPLASFPPSSGVKEALDFNGVKKVTYILTDIPQKEKNVWLDNGLTIEYMSYDVTKPNNEEFEVFVYLNVQAMKSYQWSDLAIARYIDYAFYTAVFSKGDSSLGAFDPREKARLEGQQNPQLFTFKLNNE